MTYHIITFGKRKENLRLAVEQQVIGSFLGTFKDYVSKGAIIFLHCESKVWATATVTSDYFFNESQIWDDKKYPHRFKIGEIRFLKQPIELTNGVYNVELRKRYGTGWAYSFLFSPKPLPKDIAEDLFAEAKKNYSAETSNSTELSKILS